jgi:hypothetical protein
MQMWGFWTRKQARSNSSRGETENGNPTVRRMGLCTRSSVKPPAAPGRVDSQDVTSTYVYVDNFR